MKVSAKRIIGLIAVIGIIAYIAIRVENKRIEQEVSTELDNKFEELKKQMDDEMKNNWHVNTTTDSMTDKSVVVANVRSQNDVVFDFPYEGGSFLVMNIRKRDGKMDVYFKISKGQFVCNEYQGTNNVMIRFDDNEAKNYTTVESSTHDSDILFIKNQSAIKEIYNKCLSATTIKVKVNFYSEGSRIFEFRVDKPLTAFE